MVKAPREARHGRPKELSIKSPSAETERPRRAAPGSTNRTPRTRRASNRGLPRVRAGRRVGAATATPVRRYLARLESNAAHPPGQALRPNLARRVEPDCVWSSCATPPAQERLKPLLGYAMPRVRRIERTPTIAATSFIGNSSISNSSKTSRCSSGSRWIAARTRLTFSLSKRPRWGLSSPTGSSSGGPLMPPAASTLGSPAVVDCLVPADAANPRLHARAGHRTQAIRRRWPRRRLEATSSRSSLATPARCNAPNTYLEYSLEHLRELTRT